MIHQENGECAEISGTDAAKETRVVVLIKWITRDHNNLINTLTDLYPVPRHT